MKNIRQFTNGEQTVIWDKSKCIHSAICLKYISYNIEKPGAFCIRVSDTQLDNIIRQSGICPAKAFTLQGADK